MGTIVLKMSQIRVRKITQLARQSKSVRSFATSGAASKIATKILKRVTDTVGTAPVQANENIDLSELRTLNNLEKMKENKDLSPSVNAFVKDLEKVGISPDAALSESMDSNVLRELNSLQSTINKLKTRVPSAANSIPQKFVADPTINFDGYRKLAQELQSKTDLAYEWEKAIDEMEALSKKQDSSAISQQTEDALVSVLIPVEEQFKALTESAKVMAETSKMRLAQLKEELEEARYSMANLESLNIDDVERMKPEWKKKADDDILHHRWNLVEDEEDKEAH